MTELETVMQNSLLRRKIYSWFVTILVILALALFIELLIGQRILGEFDLLLQDNTACYDVQEAIRREAEAFEDYVREASQENQNNYQSACDVTRACMEALPSDYREIGRERYARTWNLIHAYEGYVQARDAFFTLESTAGNYTDEMYRVMQMQEYLSEYALRLVNVTLEHSGQAYTFSANLFKLTPIGFCILFAVALLSVIAIMHQLSKTVALPLILMAHAARQIIDNDFSGEDLPVASNDEVGDLTLTFNRMKHAMEDQIATQEALHREEVAKLELEKNLEHTRLEMLKSQVNPHFLFNTLNMISCMARLEDADTTNKMILSLSNLFRYNLRTKAQIVALDQELEALDDYIYIQQMRFDSRIICKKDIRVNSRQVLIPSFLLQPVVENAFSHGLKTKRSGGRILLRVWQEQNDIIVSVMDNGKGMNREELTELTRKMQESEKTGKGIGLGNIHHRIKVLYPDGRMSVYSKPGAGTVIQFKLPQPTGGEKYDDELSIAGSRG